MRSSTLIAIASLAVAAWGNPVAPRDDVCDSDVISSLVGYFDNSQVKAEASAYCTGIGVTGGAGSTATVTKTSTATVKHTLPPTTVKSTITSTKTVGG
jgi:hypothetical protein